VCWGIPAVGSLGDVLVDGGGGCGGGSFFGSVGASVHGDVVGVVDVVNNPKMLIDTFTNSHGNFEMRMSSFAGPSGALAQFKTTWQVMADGARRFSTIVPYGE
jgi:hypothetical protein